MAKKILVTGYHNLNLGDDIFFKMLFERYADTIFCIVTSKNNFKPFLGNVNTKRFSPPALTNLQKLFSFFNKKYLAKKNINAYKNIYKNEIGSVDGVVHIGGSLFIEDQGSATTHSTFYRTIDECFKGVDVFFMGCNFGPYTSSTFYSDYAEYFSSVRDVCFREKYSETLFSQLSNVRSAPDIVFGLKGTDAKTERIKNSLGISLINISSRRQLSEHSEQYFSCLTNIVKKRLANGNTVRLFSFCKAEGDEAAILQLMDMLSTDERNNVEHIHYDGNIVKFISSFKEMEFLISTRFHATILGLLFSQNVYPIYYSEKIKNVLQDIDYPYDYAHISNLAMISECNVFMDKKFDVNQLSLDSRDQFNKLDTFLGYSD